MFSHKRFCRHSLGFSSQESRLIHDKETQPRETIPYRVGNVTEYGRRAVDWSMGNSANFLRGVFDGLKGDNLDDKRKQAMMSSLRDFVTTAPAAMVDLVAKAVEALGTRVTPEELVKLTSHTEWISAFSGEEVWKVTEDKDLKKDEWLVDVWVNHQDHSPSRLLRTLSNQDRQALYQQYVRGFVPAEVQEKHAGLFGARDQDPKEKSALMLNNRGKILSSMRSMLTGELPPDDPTNELQDVAYDSLKQRYGASAGFNSPLLIREAMNSRDNPNAPSFFKGAKGLGVLNENDLRAVESQIKIFTENENLVSAKVHDNLNKLDANVHLREVSNVLGKIDPMVKIIAVGLLIWAAIKNPKTALVAFGLYFGAQAAGIKDPIGSGLSFLVDSVKGIAGGVNKANGAVGWNHEKNPAELARKMVQFAQGEDLHNVEEEAEVLASLNAQPMSKLSEAFQIDRSGVFSLNLQMLYGKDLPPYFKDNNHCVAMTQAVAYLLFSHYRSVQPGNADVKTITNSMAALPFDKSWPDALRGNPRLNKMYTNVVVLGKESALGDKRQLHAFVEEQVSKASTQVAMNTIDPNANQDAPEAGFGSGTSAPGLNQSPPKPGSGSKTGGDTPPAAGGGGGTRGQSSPEPGKGGGGGGDVPPRPGK